MEWSERNKYSSFNSMKGLTYYNNYQNILRWMDGKEPLGPPIECNLDPFAACNLDCYFCITQRYLVTTPQEVGPMKRLPLDYMLRLVRFLSDWGVRGLCISGGGEPTLHSDVPEVLVAAQKAGMRTSIFTNMTVMNNELADAMWGCQFVTWSINAADGETFKAIKGIDLFERVKANVCRLMERQGQAKTFVCARMLILPENIRQIHAVCRMAKELGCGGFSIRPVDFERDDIKGHHRLALPVDAVHEQFALCHEEETSEFKVFTVTHKFDSEFHVKHDFNECLAPPLLLPILSDGNAYLCVDKKMEAPFRLGSCFPNPETILEWWGGDRHRQMMKTLDINGCSRCTFGQYNRQIEAIREDSMMVSFP